MSQNDVLTLIRLARKYPHEADPLLALAERIGRNGSSDEAGRVTEIAQEAVSFPLEVFCNYKGKRYLGMLQSNRDILINGMTYHTPSAAAMSVTRNNVNGWRWWWYVDPATGQIRQIDDLRQRKLL